MAIAKPMSAPAPSTSKENTVAGSSSAPRYLRHPSQEKATRSMTGDGAMILNVRVASLSHPWFPHFMREASVPWRALRR